MANRQIMEAYPIGTHVKVTIDNAKYVAQVVGYKGRELRLRALVKRPFGEIVIDPAKVERCADS